MGRYTTLASGTDPILGFVAVYVEAANQAGKYIQGHFDKSFNITNAMGIGLPPANSPGTPNPPSWFTETRGITRRG
jgi:hypothetical protein